MIPSKSLTNRVPDITARCGSTGELLDPGRITWKKTTKQGAFWSMLTGMITGVAWMLLGLTDIVEAVYPVVVVTYGVGIIVSLMTYKEKINLESVRIWHRI